MCNVKQCILELLAAVRWSSTAKSNMQIRTTPKRERFKSILRKIFYKIMSGIEGGELRNKTKGERKKNHCYWRG